MNDRVSYRMIAKWTKDHGCWVCPNCTERFNDKLTEILATREIRLPPHCPKCGTRVK